jgi:hypothetical protein
MQYNTHLIKRKKSITKIKVNFELEHMSIEIPAHFISSSHKCLSPHFFFHAATKGVKL